MSISYRRTFMYFMAAGAIAFAAPGCTPDAADDAGHGDSTAVDAGSDVEELNKANARRFMDEVLLPGDTTLVDSLIADDFVDHNAPPGYDSGRAGMKKWIPEFHAAFPDGKYEVIHVFAEGDMVAIHVRQTGTHTGSMMGMPPTNKVVDVRGVDFMRMRDGKAVEHWGYWEEMKMMTQLGMMPEGGAPGAAPAPGAPADSAPAADTTKK